MPNPVSDIKRKTLDRRLTNLAEEYEVASAQLDRALSDVERLRIQRQIADLDAQMQEVASQLAQLAAPAGQPPPHPIAPATVRPTRLRTAMRTVYNLAELKILCDDLAVDYEDLGGQRLENKILELIDHMRRRGRYEELVRKVLADRPIVAGDL